jgi:hypothetical protein
MADAPNTATFITRTDERTASDLPNALQLVGSSTIGLTSIGGGQYRVAAISTLASLNNLSSNGILAFNNSLKTFSPLTLSSNGTMTISNPTGVGGNPSFSVTPNTTNQKVGVYLNGNLISTRKALDFIEGSNTTISVIDDPVDDRANITISSSGGGGGGAPADAYYLTTRSDVGLDNEVNLGALASGVLFSTVASSISTVSPITPSTSGYVLTSTGPTTEPTWQPSGGGSLGPTLTTVAALTIATGDLLVGNGANSMTNLAIGTSGQAITSNGTTATWATPASPAASYITKTTDSSLSNEFALSTMTTGIVKVTTSTGDLTTAVAGTDYQAPYAALTSAGTAGSTAGSIWYGSGTNTVASLAAGTSGQLLSSGGTGAPSWVAPGAGATGTYLTTTDMTSTLPNSTDLGGLATGLIFSSVTTGTSTVTSTLGASGTVPYSTGTGVSWVATPTFTSGTATLTAGTNPTVVVNTTSVSTSPLSRILISPIFDSTTTVANVLPIYSGTLVNATSFTIGLSGTIASDLKVSWMVIN